MSRRVITAVAAVAILLGSSSLSTTQAAAPATVQGQPRAEQMKEAFSQLGLTDAQKAKIKEICSAAKSKLQAMKGATQGRSTQARQIIKAAGEKVMAVLTPAQQAKLKQLLKSSKA